MLAVALRHKEHLQGGAEAATVGLGLPFLVTCRVPMTHHTEHLGTAPLLFHQSRILMRRMYFLTEVLIIFVRNLKTIILLHKFCAIAILIDIDTKKTTSRIGPLYRRWHRAVS